MDTTYWIAAAAVGVIVLIIYIYRREISLKFKGWGFEAALSAKGNSEAAKDPPDRTRAAKPVVAGERSVSVKGNANGSTIVTGDRNKVG
jgi:hypothetical protein